MKSLTWKTSFATSVGIHAAIIVLIAILKLTHTTSVGGTDMLTLELGGPAGNNGGFGDIQKEGRQGNAGEGGDGARNYTKKRQQNDTHKTPQKEAPKTDGEQMPMPFNNVKKMETGVISEKVSKALIASQIPIKSTTLLEKSVIEEKKPLTESLKSTVEKKQKSPVKLAEKTDKTVDQKGKKNGRDMVKQVKANTNGKDGNSNKINAGFGGAVGVSGTARGVAKTEGSGVGSGAGELAGNDQFVTNGDGTYTALGSGGIAYKILTDATTKYPKEARSISFNKIVKVNVRFLVGLNGSVESVEILNTDIPNLGFKEESILAIKAMQFEPIWYRGNNIKMYFKKTIFFQP